MYCVAYIFSINTELPDAATRFVKCWTGITQHFKSEAGCIASSLVRTAEGMYCAHAHWPSLEAYTASREKTPSASFMRHRLDWAELVEQTELIFEGEILVNL